VLAIAVSSSELPLRREPVALTPPDDPTRPRHAFTVDVEDWYQSCLDYDAPITERVVRNLDRTLAVLDEARVKGTFFVQGRVAETFPEAVETLVAEGHEVQSHGYSHRPLFAMNRDELREELVRAKETVEAAAGTAVTAFRAQDFSVVASNLWALETLADVGFEVDSSVFPMRSRHYGVPGWDLGPHRVLLPDGTRILEVPVAIWALGRARFPVAGGGYFRVLPTALLGRGLREIEASGRPGIIYCHPYEFNDRELDDYPNIPRKLRLSQGIGRGRFPQRMRTLLQSLRFGRLSDVLAAWGVE
jgi:polysaccharide deacetylase family protein (PEP-CTERM system associated)